MKRYYVRVDIRNPEAYASTRAPMYETKYSETKDINAPTSIYKLSLQGGKKYVGKTTNVDRRMDPCCIRKWSKSYKRSLNHYQERDN